MLSNNHYIINANVVIAVYVVFRIPARITWRSSEMLSNSNNIINTNVSIVVNVPRKWVLES